jgi:hypothetical protein
MPKKTRRTNNNNLIFPMNNENPQKSNKKPNYKRNNTKKVNRKLTTIYANKYRNKPSTLGKQPYKPIDPNTAKYMEQYYKNTPF